MNDREIVWQSPTREADEAFQAMSSEEQFKLLGFAPDDYLLSKEDWDKKINAIIDQKKDELHPDLLSSAIKNHGTERFNFRMQCAWVVIDTECEKLARRSHRLTKEEREQAGKEMDQKSGVWQHGAITKDDLATILRDANAHDSHGGKRQPDDQIRRDVFKKQIVAITNDKFYIRTPQENEVFYKSSEKPRSWFGQIKDYIKEAFNSVFNKKDIKMSPISSTQSGPSTNSKPEDATKPKQENESKGLKH